MEPLASLKTFQAVIGSFGYEKNGSKTEISVLVFGYLVGGWTNPSEKNMSQILGIFPKFLGENKQYLSCQLDI